MIRRTVVACLAVALVVAGIVSAWTQFEDDLILEEEEVSLSYSLGDVVEPFTLECSNGMEHSLHGELGEKVIALYFWNFKCPFVVDYDDHLSEVISRYEGNGEDALEEEVDPFEEEEDPFRGSVQSAFNEGIGEWFGLGGSDNGKALIWVIDSNYNNTNGEINAYLDANGRTYIVLRDPDGEIADKFGAERTPEVVVIGKDKTIQYLGAVADNPNPNEALEFYMENAISALIDGLTPTPQETEPFGSPINRAPAIDLEIDLPPDLPPEPEP